MSVISAGERDYYDLVMSAAMNRHYEDRTMRAAHASSQLQRKCPALSAILVAFSAIMKSLIFQTSAITRQWLAASTNTT